MKSTYEAECCMHGVHISEPCEGCREKAMMTGPRFFHVELEAGGPFDGELCGKWWEGSPVEFYITTVPSDDGPFVRVYWFRWDGPGYQAVQISVHEVPRSDSHAQQMRQALGLDEREGR